MGLKLLDVSIGDDFLDMTQKAPAAKLKPDKWDYINPKSFSIAEKTINAMKRQPMNIFASHILSDKELICKAHKEFYHSTI